MDKQKLHVSLCDLIGADFVISDEAKMLSFINEPRKRYHKTALAIVLPNSVAQVQKIMRFANENKIAVIAQGGNTGLVGGQVPASGNEIILSLKKLSSIREINTLANYISVEAGLTLQETIKAAEQAGYIYPLSFASKGSAQIGGVLATNAGGAQVLAYGNARQTCLGVEAVLADGSLYSGLNSLKKDNTGYDLNNLLIGSEGTLAIITAANLKLFPKPIGYHCALVAIDSPAMAFELFQLVQKFATEKLTAFELIPHFGLELQLKHKLLETDPSAGFSPWYALVEISQFNEGENDLLTNVLESAYEKHLIKDATSIAQSEFERENIWKFREQMSECQSFDGASIKHDISVPIDKVPQLIESGIAAIAKINPNIRPCPFGHIGDGNIHFNFSQPIGMSGKDFMAMEKQINQAIYEIVNSLNGSISAEHGIGQLKKNLLASTKDQTALNMMKKIKQALDPNNILNPNKLLD